MKKLGVGCCGAQMIPKSYPGKDLVIGLSPTETKSSYHCLILNLIRSHFGGRRKETNITPVYCVQNVINDCDCGVIYLEKSLDRCSPK